MKHSKRKKVTRQRLVDRKPQQQRKRNDQARKRELARPMTAAECEALQTGIRATMWEDML